MSGSLEAWVRSRQPPVPEAFLAHLGLGDASTQAGAEPEPRLRELLTARGLAALERALARPGRDREAAFRLLAADAWLTWACEAATEEEDVAAALAAVLERVAGDRE